MRDLAARLIAHEAKSIKGSKPGSPAVFHACERLRPHLATLMGQAGFRAVLARALTVTTRDAPCLGAIEVDAEGALEGWDKLEKSADHTEMTRSGELLVAQVLGLLIAFIGDNLTLRLVRDVWPNVSLEDLKFTQGDHP